MKKIIALALIAGLVTTVSAPTFAAESDAELAALLQELDGTQPTEAPIEQNPTTQSAPEQPAEEQHQAADEILDSVDEGWALSGPEKTEVKDVTSTGAVIVTTKATLNGNAVQKYKIMYSDKTLSNLDNLKNVANVVVDVDSTDGNTVMLKFENLSPNKTYYISVVPVNPDDANKEPTSMISSEVMFTTKEEVKVEATTATVTKVFENVSYTYKENSVELTWTPSSAAEKAQIEMRHQSESAYTKVGTPMLKDGKFVFTVSKPGTYFLKLNGLDAAGATVGQEHVQTIKVDEVLKPAEPVQTAPTVGPAQDLMLALIVFATLSYGVVRFRKAN